MSLWSFLFGRGKQAAPTPTPAPVIPAPAPAPAASGRLTISAAGREMIEGFEGLRLHAYQDIVGIWTIGYGHTGPDVHAGLTWTKEQADEALTQRLRNEFEPAVIAVGRDVPTTQGQFDAMCSLAYNIGVKGFSGSEVAKHHRAMEYGQAANAFKNWSHAGGRVVQALLNRRLKEARVYAGSA